MSKKPLEQRKKMKLRHVGVALLAACGVAGLVYLAVGHATRYLESTPRYQVSVDGIELVPAQPKWIRGDLRAEALRDGSVDLPVSILDPDLASRLAEAFALHPWVDSVAQVEKSAGGILRIELSYRRPVAMIGVDGGAFAVDMTGVLLPSDDFVPDEAQAYPFVTGIESTPQGGVGNPWGDAAVTRAAEVAAALLDVWHEWQMNRITIVRGGDGISRLVLQTNSAAQIVWSRLDQDPADVAGKRARLEEYFAERGSFGAAPTLLDLTVAGPLRARTAAQGDPQSARE